jgi:hypothetical protein
MEKAVPAVRSSSWAHGGTRRDVQYIHFAKRDPFTKSRSHLPAWQHHSALPIGAPKASGLLCGGSRLPRRYQRNNIAVLSKCQGNHVADTSMAPAPAMARHSVITENLRTLFIS